MEKEVGPPIITEDVSLFSLPPVNVGTDKVQWIEHFPKFMTQKGNQSIQFTISGSGKQYTDLSKTELYVKLSIRDKNGHIHSQDPKVATAVPADNVLHTLWSSVDIYMNHNLVTSCGTNYHNQALLRQLLTLSHETRKYQGQFCGFTGEFNNFGNPTVGTPTSNYGLKTRQNWFTSIVKSQYPYGEGGDEGTTQIATPSAVEFQAPFLADICNQERLILNGVDIEIKLWPNRDELRLITSPEGREAKIVIEDIRLKVCKVTVSDETFLGHNAQLLKTPALYPFERTDIRCKDVSQGKYGDILEDIFQGELPSKIIIGMVDSEGYYGDFNRNPFWFHHYDIDRICVSVDGESVPQQPMELNFADANYLQALMGLYQVSGILHENKDIGINRDNFRQGYALFGFQLDTTSSTDNTYLGKKKTGRTRIELRWKKALPSPVTIIVFAVFPEVMEINDARIVRFRNKDSEITRIISSIATPPMIAPAA